MAASLNGHWTESLSVGCLLNKLVKKWMDSLFPWPSNSLGIFSRITMTFIKVFSMRIWHINTQPTPIRNTTVGAPSKAVENRHLDKLEGALGTQPTFLHSIFVSFMRCSCAISIAPPPNRSSLTWMLLVSQTNAPHLLTTYCTWELQIHRKRNIQYLLFSLPWKYNLKSPSEAKWSEIAVLS